MVTMISGNPVSQIHGWPPAPRDSLLRSSPAYVLLAIVIACAANFADPDLWIHVLMGQRIVRTGHIPLRDLYSYSALGLPWHNHEWFAQVVLGMSYRWLGVLGLKIVKMLCATIMVVALAVGLSRTAARPPVQRIVLLSTAAALIMQMQFRPQLFTFALLSILMAKLAAEIYSGPVRLWPLIPMFALWANFHAGCLIGLAALGVFTIILGFQEFQARRTLRRALRVAAVTAGCTLATLLNPFGTDLWATFTESLSNPLIRAFITDWRPLVKALTSLWHGSRYELIPAAVPLLMFAVFLASLWAAPAMDDAALVAIALAFMAAAFYANRNVALAVIALSIPLARHLGLALVKHEPGHRDATPTGPSQLLIALAAAIVALAGGQFSNRLKTWAPVPSGAIDFMRGHGLRGNILNNFDWGEYVIWHVTPQSHVFIDGRFELVYPDKLLQEYLGFLFGWPGGEKLLDGYPHDFVLVKPGTGAHRIMAADPRWKLVYQDTVAALFAKTGAPIARDVTGHRNGPAGPSWFP